MKTITPKDASYLTLVAEHPNMPDPQFAQILDQITDPDVKLAAQATRELMTDRPYSHHYTSDQIAIAENMIQWVTENRQLANELRTRHNV